MDIFLILYFVLFIAIVVGIFMLIKKVIYAILTVFILIILIFAGVGGLVYLDFKQLSSQKDFALNIFYGNSKNYEFGLTIPFVNQSVYTPGVKGYTGTFNQSNLGSSKDFYVFLDKNSFNNIMNSNSTYYLLGTQNLTVYGYKLNTSLTKTQVENLLSYSENQSIASYSHIIYTQSNLPSLGSISGEPLVENQIKTELTAKNITFKEVLFASVLLEETKNYNSIIKLLQDFKTGNLSIYPDRFSFKVLRMLPLGMLESFVPK